MNVLSLFDGISCACVALERCALPIETYTAVEIDKYATAVSQKNYPEIIRFNDVRTFHPTRHYDLLIGGSPCQDLSIAKKDRKGLGGDRSGLFWEYIRIKNECKPTWFVLENVASMPKKDRDIITAEMGVEPVLFNASLVSAQSRKRLFWTNIPFELPADRGIVLKDILQPDGEVDERMMMKDRTYTPTPNKKHEFNQVGYFGAENQCKVGGQALRIYDTEAKAPCLSSVGHMVKLGHIGTSDGQANRVYDTAGKSWALSTTGGGLVAKTGLYDVEKDRIRKLTPVECEHMVKVGHIGTSDAQANRVYDTAGKSCTLSANGGGLGAKTGLYDVEDKIRKLTPIECERLQGLPDNYTEGVATTNRYKCLGNAFNVDVVACILERLTRPM
jgi:DNA (cytosine-5)-methyltransferase 3A